ncbi:transcription termination factor 2 isoform X2 [Plutella xylostella]|uniref:transcription termination factor 2 isoform X2 n=1 Tax=Plutella xylostella TaxID=51655 RepID=UPI00203290E3|nr:transcription termination factor 2 isoform X2 [Plutella xylostella]
MESSFFEYRNDTGKVGSDSEGVIDDSVIADESFRILKSVPPSAKKNQTVFVAESEESSSGEETESYDEQEMDNSKSVARRSNAAGHHVVSSSDDDASKRGSIRKQSPSSPNKVLLSSSSDEDEVSPELVPRRRPPLRQKSLNSTASDSPLIRRVKKRMILTDSETDNSIIIENDKHTKQMCLKDTPAKIDPGPYGKENLNPVDMSNMSLDDSKVTNDADDSKVTNDSDNESVASEDSKAKDDESSAEAEIDDDDDDDGPNDESKAKVDESSGEADEDDDDDDGPDEDDDDDDGPDEDEMVMSRATRMSIMGVAPREGSDDSDSDFIVSDESNRKSADTINGSTTSLNLQDNPEARETMSRNSIAGSIQSLDSLPDAGISLHHTPHNTNKPPDEEAEELDDSKLSCSTFGSPVKEADETKQIDLTQDTVAKVKKSIVQNESIDLTLNDHDYGRVGKSAVLKKVDDDDEVTIIDSKPEIIALSSDDEDEPKPEKKSPSSTKRISSIKSEDPGSSKGSKENTLRQYLTPASYPGQGVVYVKKHVRENELAKLNGLKEDLKNVRYLLETMDLESLADGGVKIIERLSALEEAARRQGDKVANMLLEPENPTAQDIAKDGFEQQGLTWDDIQKASNQVQPRLFGKQAMSTHMAERNLILDRLRALHSALDSRPPESASRPPPPSLRATLMPHQAHALAWLAWREQQKPRGGILADDMGLGKTITMIALVLTDKETLDDDDEDDEDEEDDDRWKGKGSSKAVHGGTLVVCCASLLQQWAGEVARHVAPHALTVHVHHGAQRHTQPSRLAGFDMVVTTYNILQKDNEKNGVLLRMRWRRVILDEAHIVRNHKSATSVAVCTLRGARRWALTGTPVQNKDLDVFALLKFLKLTPFDELPMWKKWIDNKSAGGQERLATIMRCVMLRRCKQQLQAMGQLQCLPARDEVQVAVTLQPPEMNVYQKVLVFSKTLFAQFLQQRAEKQADGGFGHAAYDRMHKKMVALQGGKPVKSHEILVLLLRLRQVCCHCGLIASMLGGEDLEDAGGPPEDTGVDLLKELNKLTLDEQKDKIPDEETEPEFNLEGTTAAEAIRSVLSPGNPVFQLTRRSSKIEAVMKTLQEKVFVNKGDKAVVVSQWTSVLRLVEQELDKLQVQSVTLSGSVPVSARTALITQLNDPNSKVKVMLLSLCAGGVGLNLCGANHLLLLDPHWNPQLEQQAQDRIYRVGQRKHVLIYRFMCVETVEQSIRKLQEMKLQVAENVLTGARHNGASKLSIEDLKMLFNMGQA